MGLIENFAKDLRNDLAPIKEGYLQRFGTPEEKGRVWASENRLGQLAVISLQVRKLVTDHRAILDTFTTGGRVEYPPVFDPKDRKSATRAIPAKVALFAIYHATRVNGKNVPEPQIKFNPNADGKGSNSIFTLEISNGVHIAATLLGQEKNRAIANAINIKRAKYRLSIIVDDPSGTLTKESREREKSFFEIGTQLQPDVVLRDILTRRPNANNSVHSFCFYNVSTYFDKQYVIDYLSKVWDKSKNGDNPPAKILRVSYVDIDHTDNRGRKLEVRFEEDSDFYESRRSARIKDLDSLVKEELNACFKHAHLRYPVTILGNGKSIFDTRYQAPIKHDAVFKHNYPSLNIPYFFNSEDVRQALLNNLGSLHVVLHIVNNVKGTYGRFHERRDLEDVIDHQPISIHYEIMKLSDDPKSHINVVAWRNKSEK